MPSSGPSSSQELKYPPVRVDHSFTKLDLDTLMMRSTSRRQPEEAGSSLDESTYELLDDSLDTSDDEAHTESIASTNGPTPDDASDFSDDDNDYGAANVNMHCSIDASIGAAAGQQFDMQAVASGEDSTLTEAPAQMEASESWKIGLDEEPTEEAGVVLGRKVLKSFPDHEGDLPQVLHQYGCAQVRLVVRAALSPRSVPPPDSYKILYIGMPEQWLEDIITSQIGAALTASPSVSKSVMVRGQIEPYGPVIHVYRCAELHAIAEHEKSSHVHVTLDDGQQLKFGPGQKSYPTDRPDLVVFCHPTILTAPADVQGYARASEIFQAESIPCIDLVQTRPYGDGMSMYDLKSLRVCVEGRNDANTDYELKEVLPLDPYTFSQLEPMQLNRHLALISPHLLLAQAARDTKKGRISWIGGRSKSLNHIWQPMKMLITVLAFCALIPALFQGAAYAPLLFQKSPILESQSSISSEVLTLTPTVTSGPFLCRNSPAVESAARDLTVVPPQPQAKLAKQLSEKKDKNMPGYGIQVTGVHQFILTPSKELAKSRRKLQVQIQISRDLEVVPARFNQTNNGEYIVDLEREYTFSNFNVSIATLSKPFLRQYFEVTLGHNKSTLAQLLEITRLNFIHTQDNLRNLSSTTLTFMQARLANLEANLEATTLLWTDELRESSQEVTGQLQNAMFAVQRQVNAGTQFVKAAPGATWMGMRKATAPVRTSSPMLKARMNALRLRCKMETTMGISSRKVDGKQSWACAKVQGEA